MIMNRQRAETLIAEFHLDGGQSDFQLDTFVVGQNGITEWGCFRQILREIDARHEVIDSAEEGIARERFRFGALSARRKAGHRKTIDRASRELDSFYSLLRASHVRLLEEGPLTPERCRDLEVDYYEARFRLMALTDIASNGTIQSGLLASIAFMPRESRSRILDRIDQARSNPRGVVALLQAEPEALIPPVTSQETLVACLP